MQGIFYVETTADGQPESWHSARGLEVGAEAILQGDGLTTSMISSYAHTHCVQVSGSSLPMAGRHGRPWKRLFVRIVCVDILPFWFVLGWYVVLLSGPSAFGVEVTLQ